MPAQWTLASLPVPNDPAVELVAVPAATYAVLRFTGSTSAEAVAPRRAELASALAGSGWVARGEPVAWFYDPPWTIPFLRRNEVPCRSSGSEPPDRTGAGQNCRMGVGRQRERALVPAAVEGAAAGERAVVAHLRPQQEAGRSAPAERACR